MSEFGTGLPKINSACFSSLDINLALYKELRVDVFSASKSRWRGPAVRLNSNMAREIHWEVAFLRARVSINNCELDLVEWESRSERMWKVMRLLAEAAFVTGSRPARARSVLWVAQVRERQRGLGLRAE